MFTNLKMVNESNIGSFGDLNGKLIAYGEDSSGYIARVFENTVNGLSFEFILENYEWIYIIGENK